MGKSCHDAVDGKPKKQERARLEALPALRFLAELQIIGFHFYTNTSNPWLNNFNEWGCCPLTFFFLLSGFIFGYIYGAPHRHIEWWDFMAKRFAGLYPLYLTSIITGFALAAPHQPRPTALILVMLLTASKALPSTFWNPISAPAWTVGAFFILYALLPYSLRMLKSASSRTRLYILPPLFLLGSLAMPAVTVGWNTGILHMFTRTIGICSIANFLQGLNLGLLYLEHDWSKHPMVLQRIGASAMIAFIVVVAAMVPYKSMPIFVILWRDHGLMTPVYCLLIWYTARDRDIVCRLLKTRPMQFLGNISYGMYLFQQITFTYLTLSSQHYKKYGHIQPHVFLATLIGVAAFGVHLIQNNYTEPLYQWLRKKVQVIVHKDTSPWQCAWEVMMVLLELPVIKTLSLLCFISAYALFVNYQGCKPITCHKPSWSTYMWPSGLYDRPWFTRQDVNWAINWWALPCEKRSWLSPNSRALAAIVGVHTVAAVLAFPALVTLYLLMWRVALLGNEAFASRAKSLLLPAYIRRNVDLAKQHEKQRSMMAAAVAFDDLDGTEGQHDMEVGYQVDRSSLSRDDKHHQHQQPKQPCAKDGCGRDRSGGSEQGLGCDDKECKERGMRVYFRLLVRPGLPTRAAEGDVCRHVAFLSKLVDEGAIKRKQKKKQQQFAQGGPMLVIEVLGWKPSKALLGKLPPETRVVARGETRTRVKGEASPPEPSSTGVVFFHEGRDATSMTDLVILSRELSDARPGDRIIYLSSGCRLDRGAVDECLSHLDAADGDREIALVSDLQVNGSDDVMPNIFTIGHMSNILDRRRSQCCTPAIALTQYETEDAVAASHIADAVEFGRCDHRAPFCHVALTQGRAYFQTRTWSHYKAGRVDVLRGYLERQRTRALADVVFEAAMHLAFLAATAILLLSPVYANYNQGWYQYWGSGWDCQNGRGYGTEGYRKMAALVAALYTGVYFKGLITHFSPRDGLVRMTVLFYFMLLLLPVMSLLELVITACSVWSSLPVLMSGAASIPRLPPLTQEQLTDKDLQPLLHKREDTSMGILTEV